MTGEPFRHSPGVFGAISWVFQRISDVFSWLGNAASRILFVRGVASFFYTIDFWAWEAAIEFGKADEWARVTWDAILDRMRWDDWPNALAAFAGELRALQDDPKGWFRYLAWRISDHLGWFVYDPVKWLQDRIRYNYPVLWAFVSDPRLYILARLWETHPELYWFLLDPLGWITHQIGDVLNEVRWFIRDPFHFVHWQLLKMDSPLAPFWWDPWGTILIEIGERIGLPAQWWWDWPDCVVDLVVDKAEGYYERHKDRVYHLGEHILRFMWEGVW